jgi:SP family arabinose:H+ symporter-like MFS transporter
LSINKYVVRSTLVGALGGWLFGFNTAVISGTTAGLTHAFGLSVRQLGITVSIALWGTVVGALAAGVLGQRYGSREMLRLTAVLYLISSIGCAIAPILPLLLVARFLGGLGIGGSSVLGPVYIAELAPAHLRGRLVGTFQVNIVIGILLAYLSNYLISLLRLGAHEWRWEFGVASVPALRTGLIRQSRCSAKPGYRQVRIPGRSCRTPFCGNERLLTVSRRTVARKDLILR